MAESGKQGEPSTSKGPDPPITSVPRPPNLDENKLNWLLQVNEDLYQQELKKIVSISFKISLIKTPKLN